MQQKYNPYTPEAVEYWHYEVTKHIGWVIKYVSEYFITRGYKEINMIDIGCCTGRLVQKMNEVIPVKSAILIDAISEFIEYAENLFGDKYFYEYCVLNNINGFTKLTTPEPYILEGVTGINLGGATAQKVGVNYRSDVPMKTFDSIWKEKYIGFKPDVIKIDAEGLDINILEGMSEFLHTLDKKPLIVYEYAGLNMTIEQKNDILNRLKFLIEMGYTPVIEDNLVPSKCCDMMISVE